MVPTVNGEVFDEKPILYFWLALVAAALTGGVSELSLRLPTAVAGLAATLLLYLLVRSHAARTRALLAGLFLSTTFVVFWSARQVQMDLLLMACTLASVLGAMRALDRPGAGAAGWLLAGAAAGLGFLAKGPVGLLCPALVVVAYAVATRRGRALVDPGASRGSRRVLRRGGALVPGALGARRDRVPARGARAPEPDALRAAVDHQNRGGTT